LCPFGSSQKDKDTFYQEKVEEKKLIDNPCQREIAEVKKMIKKNKDRV
jgi:hypothetical protein